MKLYLYVKTHDVTGLKYFGFTKRDPNVYRGSGKKWLQHLREFGNGMSTEVIGVFADKAECAAVARKFSAENDIARSPVWLNMIPETLGGGTSNGHKCRDSLRAKYGNDYFQRIALENTRAMTPEKRAETNRKISSHPNASLGGLSNIGRVRLKITCPFCMKEGAKNVMKRWHFDNCKHGDVV